MLFLIAFFPNIKEWKGRYTNVSIRVAHEEIIVLSVFQTKEHSNCIEIVQKIMQRVMILYHVRTESFLQSLCII
jgi:hypothetical protein